MESRVVTAIVAAALGWGLAGVGTRALFEDGAATFTVIVVRTLVATAAVVAYAAFVRRPIGRRAWRDGSLIGLVRIGAAPVLFIASLNYVSAGVEALLITLIPVVTAVMGHFLLGEELTHRQVAGLALALCGTVVIIVSGESGIAGDAGDVVRGGALALGGVVTGSFSGIMSRHYAPHHDTATLAVPMFVAGAVATLAAGLLFRDLGGEGLDAANWALLVALGLGSTLLPFVATLYASRHATAARVALTAYLAPLVAVIGGAVLLDEVVTVSIAVGGAFTLAGVVIAGTARHPVVDLVD